MVRPVSAVPGAAGAPGRRPPRPAGGRRVVHPVPPRRPDRGRRRLPRGAPGGRGTRAGAGRRRATPGGSVDDPHGRVHGVGRDDRAEPAARPGTRRRPRWRRRPGDAAKSATCPTCSATSRRCPRSCASPGSSTRSCGGACRATSSRRASGGGRPTDRRCGPSTSTARTPTARDIPAQPEQLVARARGYEAELGPAALPGGGMLLMNGSDHLLPQPWLGRVVAEANAEQHEYQFAVTSLGEYVREQPSTDLATWCGELRSGARANVLMGVASNRVDVHQAAARAERSLERFAEPLSALFLERDAYPGALLEVGWRHVILNSAHDSSCACSDDEVVEAVRVRYQEARHVGEALTRDALQQLATGVDAPPSSTIVVNSAAPRPFRPGRGTGAGNRSGALRRRRRRHRSARPRSCARVRARASRPWWSGRRSAGCSK